MPKIVDHDARRQEISDSVLQLAVSEGLEAVTLRRVATEAGMSMGTVQHYFAGKQQMISYAFDTMSKTRAERVQNAVTGLGPDAAPRTVIRTMITEVLPLTAQSRFEALVGAAYYIRSVNDPETRRVMAAGPKQVIAILRRLLISAAHDQLLDPAVDPTAEAQILWSLMEPAGVIAGYRSKRTTLRMVDYHLDRLFGTSST